MFMFLCQYHGVLIIVALKYSLMSGRIILTLFFFLKIALVIWSLLWLYEKFHFWNFRGSNIGDSKDQESFWSQ